MRSIISIILLSILVSGQSHNLDMPYNATPTVQESEEAPESFQFYSKMFEGDAAFYVIDRSGSMINEIKIAKSEIIRNIHEFSERMEFAIVFFNHEVSKFPSGDTPVKATMANKAAAIRWVEAQKSTGSSCVMDGLREGLKYARKSRSKRRVLIYVGDGGGTCHTASTEDEKRYLQDTLTFVGGQNQGKKIRINSIGVPDVRPVQDKFLRSLAIQNRGTYRRIDR